MKDENKLPLIHTAGAGGGSEDSETRTPVVAADTVQSKAFLAVLDLLGEGQIKGLVGDDPETSIFLDGTSLANIDGSKNYSGYTWEFRDGKQVQDYIPGFPDTSTPFNVGVKVTRLNPYTITVNDPNADKVRVVVTIPALSSQDTETGDTNGTTVRYEFAISVDDAPFVSIKLSGEESSVVEINDKSRSKYQRQHMITLPKPGASYKIKLTRLTADSDSSYLLNDTYLDSYYEVIDSALTYPNSALLGFNIDSSQFSQIPSRSYLVEGLYVQIPSNYDPETRTYDGIWDGSFKIGYTNNPAWILRDLMLNERYGLGEYIKPSNINVGRLYTISRYCDGMVSDGNGSEEPRFTINTVIQAQRDAYKVIQDICSVFRGMSYWNGGMVQFTQDAPSDPVFLYNNANVVDGVFNRVGSARKDRHSVVHVTWNDPLDLYKQKIEYVEDKDLIEKLGYRKMDTIAFGCTSRAQAHRVGMWILYTESAETNVMTFEVGLEGVQVLPGDIVTIHDQYKAGKRNGGRLKNCTKTRATLDAPTEVSNGSVIAIRMPNGKFEEREVLESGLVEEVSFVQPLSELPISNTVWILTELNLVPQLARVVGVNQSDTKNQFVISVVDHNPSKYGSIEQGLTLQTYPTTILDPTNSQPENLLIEETTYLVAPGQLGTKLEVSWEGKSPLYYIDWRSNDGTGATGWTQETSNKASFELLNVKSGAIYDFSVVAQSITGRLSNALVGTYTTLGTMNPPSPPTNLTAEGNFQAVTLAWINSTVVDFDFVEIFENDKDDLETAYYLDRTPGNGFIRGGVPTLMKYWYWVRTVNKRGMRSAFNSTAGTSAVAGVIARTDLDESLGTIIDTIGGDIDGLIEDVLEKVNEVTEGLPERLSETEARVLEAEALAAAARSGNYIEGYLRDDTNIQLKRDIYELGVEVSEDINAKITEVNEVMATDRQSVAQKLTVVEARFQANEAALVSEQTARADADGVQATNISALQVKTDNTNAALTAESTARANADSASVTEINALKVKTDTTNASLITESQTRANADSAMAGNITALQAKTDTTNANLIAEQTARANADSAQVSSITALQTKTDTTNANLATEQTVRANADSAMATDITALKTTTGNNTAAITAEATARTNADGALGTRIDGVVATSGANAAAIVTEQTARSNADSALSTRIDQLVSKTDATNAALQVEATARADRDSALTTLVTTAQSTANGASTAVQTTSSALATLDGKLSSQWTVKVQTTSSGYTYLAGMGIGIQTTDQGIAQSQIAMQADRFVVYNPSNGQGAYPFQIIGGVTYISSAMIQNASITTAKIADAAITSAKIADANITSAKIADASITTAKIGSAQVNTLHIQGNAVTVPTSASGGSSATTSASDFGGGAVSITAQVAVQGSSGYYYMYIYRDGTLIQSRAGYSNASSLTGMLVEVFVDYPGTGSHYYGVASGGISGAWCGITALGVKR